MQISLLDTEAFKKQFNLTFQQFDNLMKKNPPHLNIEGSIFFMLDETLVNWLVTNYKTNKNNGPSNAPRA